MNEINENEKLSDWPHGKPTDREVEKARRKGSYTYLSPLERITRRNALTNTLTLLLIAFFVGWLLAASFWKYDIIDFKEGSFTAVTVDQAAEYNAMVARHGPSSFVSFMQGREAVFHEDDIVQFYISYCKNRDIPADVIVTIVPHFDDGLIGTTTPYIARSSDLPMGCHESFLLTEQVRPGTIAGTYSFRIVYPYRKPIGGVQEYRQETGMFTVAPKLVE